MEKIVFIFALVTTTMSLDDSSLQEFTTGNNLLTSDIYKLLVNKSENFLVSPFSAETILALTASGAKGQTGKEIRTSLHLPSKKKSEEIFSVLIPQLKNEEYVLESANKIYVKEKFFIHEEFRRLSTEIYHAQLQNVDFNQKKAAANEINGWVRTHTKNKIRDIISEEDLTPNTRLILINALYFKGNWSVPFKASETFLEVFHPKEGEVINVDTMHAVKNYNYYESAELDAKFLELSFRGNDVSMVIVLPNSKTGILSLEAKIDKVFKPQAFTRQLVRVALPKFKIETSINFKEILQELGVYAAFGGPETDFSGIAGNPGDLHISSVAQKTFIDVSEEGVEAAAATIIGIEASITSVHRPTRQPKLFIADHPFIFYVKAKGVVLFGGRVSRPQ